MAREVGGGDVPGTATGLAYRTLARLGVNEGVPAYIAAIILLMVAFLVLGGPR